MQNLRGFKAEAKPATNSAPERVKLTDLRYNKTIILSYGANTASNQKNRVIEHLESLGIKIIAQTWAEVSGRHTYSIYLTDNFDTELK